MLKLFSKICLGEKESSYVWIYYTTAYFSSLLFIQLLFLGKKIWGRNISLKQLSSFLTLDALIGHIIAFIKKKNKKSLYDRSVVIHKFRTLPLLVLGMNKNNPFKYHFWKVINKSIIQVKHARIFEKKHERENGPSNVMTRDKISSDSIIQGFFKCHISENRQKWRWCALESCAGCLIKQLPWWLDSDV